MLTIKYTNKMKRDVKCVAKRGKDIDHGFSRKTTTPKQLRERSSLNFD